MYRILMDALRLPYEKIKLYSQGSSQCCTSEKLNVASKETNSLLYNQLGSDDFRKRRDNFKKQLVVYH